MKVLLQLGQLSVAVAAAFMVAGCGASQGALSPSGSNDVSRRVSPLSDPSAQVGITNDWTAAISGSGSAPCWTISPGLPIIGAGDSSGPITLTYTPLCPTISTLPITYGPAASTGGRCTFNTLYSASGFSFSVVQSSVTDCKIVYPPNGLNAIFVYNQLAPGARRALFSRMH